MKYPSFPKNKKSPEYKLHRRLEMFPGLLTWSVFIGAILLSFFAPVWAAVFIILYDLYWLIKIVVITGHSILSYTRMRKAVRLNWLNKCEKLKVWDGMKLKTVYHLIVIPYYKEGLEILEPAIKSIVNANYDTKKVIISMSAEERGGKQAVERQLKLKKKYGKYFKEMLVSVHPDLEEERKIKSVNANWAVEKGIKYLKANKIPISRVIVSNFDCDTCIHPEYLAKVSYHFLKSRNRYRESYQPLPMYHNNIWDTFSIVRVIAISSSFWHMIESTRPERMVTFSSHSMSLKALIDVGLWQRDVISEDSAIFWQSFIYYNGRYQVVPLYLPVSMDATLSTTFFKTIANQYRQKRRWAYGIEHFPRVARAFLKNKKIPRGEKFRRLFNMVEGHHSWATASILILIMGWLPVIIGGAKFNETVIAHNLPMVTRGIMTLAMLGLLTSMFLSFYLLPPKPEKYSNFKYLVMVFQWVLVPFIAPFMGSLPAIDSQTRLMLGKHFQQFWVSEKIRKE